MTDFMKEIIASYGKKVVTGKRLEEDSDGELYVTCDAAEIHIRKEDVISDLQSLSEVIFEDRNIVEYTKLIEEISLSDAGELLYSDYIEHYEGIKIYREEVQFKIVLL